MVGSSSARSAPSPHWTSGPRRLTPSSYEWTSAVEGGRGAQAGLVRRSSGRSPSRVTKWAAEITGAGYGGLGGQVDTLGEGCTEPHAVVDGLAEVVA